MFLSGMRGMLIDFLNKTKCFLSCLLMHVIFFLHQFKCIACACCICKCAHADTVSGVGVDTFVFYFVYGLGYVRQH